MYWVKTPSLIKKWFSSLVWDLPTEHKIVYLTFDDGPHPTATNFVLQQLQQYNAKASFFCIGKNVAENPSIYQQIIQNGHVVANHTHNHVNGFKTSSKDYLQNVIEAKQYINSQLFRPPYGRITPFQKSILQKAGFKIVMWDVLSGDFDTKITSKQCTENVLLYATNGSIIVFHDSEKAFPHLQIALPQVLAFFSNKGFEFKGLPTN